MGILQISKSKIENFCAKYPGTLKFCKNLLRGTIHRGTMAHDIRW
jgi:hypothetical protein